jgi:urease beta subunit
VKLSDLPPGAILPLAELVEVNAGLPVTTIRVTNDGAYPVHLTAHFHLFEANPMLRFDRRRAFGMRPDVSSGGAIRFEAGETKLIKAVPIAGRRIVYGFAGLVDGPLDDADVDAVLRRAIDLGYRHEAEAEE